MSIILPALGVGFAGFTVWLAVRIVNRRERWAKRTAAVLVVLIALYPLSAGPTLWLWLHVLPKDSLPVINAIYDPMRHVVNCSQATMDATRWYYGLWVDWEKVSEKLSSRDRERPRTRR